MRRIWLVIIISAILVTGAGVVSAQSIFEPPLPLPYVDPEFIEDARKHSPYADSHLESEAGDCIVGITHDKLKIITNQTTVITITCAHSFGGGGGGGGGPERDGSNLFPYSHDYIDWEQADIHSCELMAKNSLRHAESGPSTLSVFLNCWWYEKVKETITNNATMTAITPDLLAAEADHAIVGWVLSKDTVTVSTDDNTNGTEKVFTDVNLVVIEDVGDTYNNSTIIVRTDGGETEDVIFVHEDAPRFFVDDRVFMFVSNPDPTGPYGDVHYVTGQKYGLYNLREGDIAESQDYSRHTTLDELRRLVEAAQSSVE